MRNKIVPEGYAAPMTAPSANWKVPNTRAFPMTMGIGAPSGGSRACLVVSKVVSAGDHTVVPRDGMLEIYARKQPKRFLAQHEVTS